MDLRVPPLVGVYGRAGTGKTTDKIRAFPNAYFLANPGGLVPMISEVGLSPDPKRIADINKVANIDQMRSTVENAISRDRTIKEVVIDDFSMIANKTEREVKAVKKDGRMAYGIIADKAAQAFEDWRNFGITVVVDCHIRPPEWDLDEEKNEKAHISDNLVMPGGPVLPGRKAGPEAVKAFDVFYRVGLTENAAGALASAGGYVEPWPWRYFAGPYTSDAYQWDTKDRWGIARPNNKGELPLNLGEILRFASRKYGAKWSVPRAKAYEKDEEMVTWATTTIQGGASQAQVYQQVGAKLVEQNYAVERIHWILRDIAARVEIERLHSRAEALRSLGINIGGGGITNLG